MPWTRWLTSPIASAIGLPCSAVSFPATSLAFSSISCAAVARIAARFSTSVVDHPGKARFAFSTASSTSATDAAGTSSTVSSVAGLTTSITSLAVAWRHSPPISISGIASLLTSVVFR
jgi:hypothetical protein